MSTDISTLISPEVLTVEIALLLAILLACMLFASLKLRSMFGIFGFMLMIVTLTLTILTDLSFIWFWAVTIAESFILVLASFAYSRAAARGNR